MACLGVPSARRINLVSDRYQRFYESLKRTDVSEDSVLKLPDGIYPTAIRLYVRPAYKDLHDLIHDKYRERHSETASLKNTKIIPMCTYDLCQKTRNPLTQ